MFTRPFALISCAAAITGALLLVMTTLIQNGVAAPLSTNRPLDRYVSVPKPPTPPQSLTKPSPPPPPMPPPARGVSEVAVDPWEPAERFVIGDAQLGAGINDASKVTKIAPASIDDGPVIEVMPVQPVYPRRMMARGLQGSVVVTYDITATGRVTNARVVSSTHTGFETSAIEAIERFRYQPRVVDGQPTPTQGLYKQFSFTIEQ